MCYSWAPPAFISLYPPLCDITPNMLFPSASVSGWQLSSISAHVTLCLNCVLRQDGGRRRKNTQLHSTKQSKCDFFFLPVSVMSLLDETNPCRCSSGHLVFPSWMLWFMLESPSDSPGLKKKNTILQKKELFISLRILLPPRKCFNEFLHITVVLKTRMYDWLCFG